MQKIYLIFNNLSDTFLGMHNKLRNSPFLGASDSNPHQEVTACLPAPLNPSLQEYFDL